MRAEIARVERKLDRYFEAFEAGTLSTNSTRSLPTEAPEQAKELLRQPVKEIRITTGTGSPDLSGAGGGSRNAS